MALTLIKINKKSVLTLHAKPSIACLLTFNTKTSTGSKTGKLKMLIMVLLFSAFEAIALIKVKMAEKPMQASTNTRVKSIKFWIR